MKKRSLGEVLSRFHHFGVIVKNLDEAARFFESIGLGPFTASSMVHIDRRVRDQPVEGVKNAAKNSTLGYIGFEVVEPVSGNSVQKEWLDKRGEGINHLCFVVDDIKEASDLMVEAGFESISSSNNKGGGGMAYFTHERFGDLQIELEELPPHLADDPFWGIRPWEK